MKALSIRQPWAWLIVNGYKPVENRTWPTQHRGRTLIHAGQVFDGPAVPHILQVFPELRGVMPQQYDLGGIVGVVDIVDCVQQHPSRWFSGPFGFVCARPRPLTFHRWKGELGFFRIPDDQADGMLRELSAAPAEQGGLF